MKTSGFHRLHALRMQNDEAKYRQEELRARFHRLADRHENGTAPRAIAVSQLFQTPPYVAARLAEMLNVRGGRLLEPSAGLGRLLDAMKGYEPREVVAVEIAAECAGELFRQERAGLVIKQRDFLTVSPEDLGAFDAVIMNPPFTMRSDIRHILHARKFVVPGGRLAAICMDTEHRREALRGLCDQWVELKYATFRDEGTRVPVVMLTMQL